METTKYSKVLLGLLAICAMFTSCSDDENDNNGGNGTPSNVTIDLKSVFTGGMPKSVGDVKSITYNEDGLVSTMTTRDGGNITFEYANVSTRAENRAPVVRMTITYGEGEFSQFTMLLGNNGFVKDAQQVEKDLDGTQEYQWSFKYNADGQISYMKKSEGDKEVFISYKNGDIVNVKQETEDNDNWEQNVLYTSPTVSSPIENKGCIMPFDDAFGIDMDDMAYAYYAGLLGKATKHLPVGVSDEQGDSYYQWTFDGNGYPTSVKIDGYTYSFSW